MKLEELTEATEPLKSAQHYIDYLEDHLEDIVDKFKDSITNSDSVAAAPDSSKFKATRGGMLEVEHRVQVEGGQYGFPKFFPVAIKVGGKIDPKIHEAIKDEVKELWDDVIDGASNDAPHTVVGHTIKTKQGRLTVNAAEGGTNWSAYGVSLSKG